MKIQCRHKGFTLIELLIVIVVIGILSAMMMFSSTEAVSSAKAANVINDLTILRKAIIGWYADNYHRVTKKYNGTSKRDEYLIGDKYLGQFAQDKKGEQEFLRYIKNNKSIKLTKDNNTKPGEFLLATEGNKWYVGYDAGSDMRLREKIAGRAKSLMLQGATKKVNANGTVGTDTDNIHPYTAKDQKVYMLIMQF